MQKLINAENDWNDEKCLKFNINPYIEVKVQKSALSLEKVCKYFYCDKYDKDRKFTDAIESNIVLECLIDFLLEVSILLVWLLAYKILQIEPLAQPLTTPKYELCANATKN